MKKNTFIFIFITVHILFAGLQIYKQNEFTKLSYEHQKKERFKEKLIGEKGNLMNQKYALSAHTGIKQFAQSIGLEPISIPRQVKKLPGYKTEG